MAKFHDKIRTICSEVELFLTTNVKDQKLSTKAKAEKASILTHIRTLREEWPQLHTVESAAEMANHDNGSAGSANSGESAPNEVIRNDVSAASIKDGAQKWGHLKRKAQGKKGLFGPKDKKCWCAIKDHTFYMFDKENSKKQTESFSTDGVTCEVVDKENNKKEYSFEVKSPGTNAFTLSAATQEEATEWIAAITGEEVDECLYEDAEPDRVAPSSQGDGELYSEADEQTMLIERVEESRSSEIYDDTVMEQDDNVYEDQDDPPPVPPPMTKHFTKRPPQPQDDQVYDDTGEPDDEIYDDGTSVPQDGNPDDLYDDLDEVAEEARKPDILRRKNNSSLHSQPVPLKSQPLTPPIPPSSRKNVSSLHSQPVPLKSQPLPQPISPSSPPPAAGPFEFDPDADYDNYYYTLWDCEAKSDDELAARRGDILYIRSKPNDYNGWWVGQVDGYIGLVPAKYLSKAYVAV